MFVRRQRREIAAEDFDRAFALVNEADEKIGDVTSGTQSPSLSKGIGLGYVQTGLSAPGSKIFVQVRGKNHPATVVKLPFVPGTE